MISINSSKLIYDYYDYSSRTMKTTEYLENFNPKETYCMILSLGQEKIADRVDHHPRINILFKSPQCVNANPGHGTKPRNTLYIFQVKEDQPLSKVPAKRP